MTKNNVVIMERNSWWGWGKKGKEV